MSAPPGVAAAVAPTHPPTLLPSIHPSIHHAEAQWSQSVHMKTRYQGRVTSCHSHHISHIKWPSGLLLPAPSKRSLVSPPLVFRCLALCTSQNIRGSRSIWREPGSVGSKQERLFSCIFAGSSWLLSDASVFQLVETEKHTPPLVLPPSTDTPHSRSSVKRPTALSQHYVTAEHLIHPPSIRAVQHWWWRWGLLCWTGSQRSSSSRRCWTGLRSGSCLNRSSPSTPGKTIFNGHAEHHSLCQRH